MQLTDISYSEEIFTVSRLNREIRLLLEGNFPLLWIEGEISNFAIPSSGHWYFSLKDSTAQVRAAMFRPQNRRLTFLPKDGLHVIIRARVSLYEGRGDFQLIVEHMEEAGVGKLQKKFEECKKRLKEAGLFDERHKKSFPTIPKCLGVITSTTGAAIRDILHVLKRRFSAIPVIIYPTLVQGEFAASEIVEAIKIANRRKECDCIILARGGGSIEDLWPFNEERVAYAIYQSQIPIMTGIGHEIDFTIADFVADRRAPTPSAAAELLTPDSNVLVSALLQQEKRLLGLLKQQLTHLLKNLLWITKHLDQQHPKRRLKESMQRLDLIESTLVRLQYQRLESLTDRLKTYALQYRQYTPLYPIRDFKQTIALQFHHLKNQITALLSNKQQYFAELTATLNTLSPLATLERGYAIATSGNNKKILRSAKEVKQGEKIDLRLAEGSIECTVDKI